MVGMKLFDAPQEHGLRAVGGTMKQTSEEDKIRRRLSFTRLFQAYIPLSVSRWMIKKGNARVQLDPAIKREMFSANGVPYEWFEPPGGPKEQVLLYLHGGGFVFGVTPPHLEFMGYLAKHIGLPILMVDYRVAPDDPFPAALDDCVAAYQWLLEQNYSARQIVIAGDSAGGNLVITSMMKLRENGIPLPAAAACLSPVGDLAVADDHPERNNDPLLHPKAMKHFRKSYVANKDPRNPLLSPVYGSFAGLPPLLIHAGEDEILRDDALRLHELANEQGVDAQVKIYPRMWHVWQLYLSLPQTEQSIREIADFFILHLNQALTE
ncbi:MAG: alpha/beta hydrolase [Deltaproteobacteria bacterium]|nr:MAG: alpha/beta hydrolase [Deltaproteobacteria bacterium]